MSAKTISVIGLGYIGLPTAAVFASKSMNVIGVDINQRAVDTINGGGIHIVEPDLDQVVKSAVAGGFLRASVKPEPAEAFLIAVPTPFMDDHAPDLSFIESACRSIAPVLRKGNLVILESTSPVGTTELVATWLSEARRDLSFPPQCGESSDIRVAYCPERVLPGNVLRELVQNDRIIGGMTPACSKAAVNLYKTFVQGDCIVTSCRTAEMCKLAENSFRDVNIAYANELSVICAQLKIPVWELIELANRHPRVKILQPGPGVGGHCIAVDPWFIVSQSPDQARLIRTAREVNDGKPGWVISKVREALAIFLQTNPQKSAKDVRLVCLGLAFKPNIDDLRESPALSIANDLARQHPGPVIAVEPHIKSLPSSLAGRGVVLMDALDAIRSADIVLALVAHAEFSRITRDEVAGKSVVDTCGLWR